MSFQSKFNKIAPTQARPPKSSIFPDHPHPTMLVEGGQEPGDGPGWRVGKQNKEMGEEGKYKAKQREFYLVGNGSRHLLIENLMLINSCHSRQSFELGLPDRILSAPNDGCIHSGCILRGWDHPLDDPSILNRAYARHFSSRFNLNLKSKEVEI